MRTRRAIPGRAARRRGLVHEHSLDAGVGRGVVRGDPPGLHGDTGRLRGRVPAHAGVHRQVGEATRCRGDAGGSHWPANTSTGRRQRAGCRPPAC